MSFTFPRDAIFLIAGPCVLESDALNLRVGEHLARLAERVPGGIVYKASFDKANRSNAGAARGPGLDEGLAALDRVRRATGLPLLTDVHLPEQCAPAAEVVDVLQIPAFLCRQTDLLVAAGATGKPVNIKKGQWMHPEGMRGAVEKVRGAGTGNREQGTEAPFERRRIAPSNGSRFPVPGSRYHSPHSPAVSHQNSIQPVARHPNPSGRARGRESSGRRDDRLRDRHRGCRRQAGDARDPRRRQGR